MLNTTQILFLFFIIYFLNLKKNFNFIFNLSIYLFVLLIFSSIPLSGFTQSLVFPHCNSLTVG